MGSCNIMGNTKTLNIIRGKDKIKWVTHGSLTFSIPASYSCYRREGPTRAYFCRVYVAAVEFDKNDKVKKAGNCKRSFCTECSSMLWNYHDEYPDVSQRTSSHRTQTRTQQLLRSECTVQ